MGALGAAADKPREDLANRLVILANTNDPESEALARFYAAERNVPVENIIALPMAREETISWRQFLDDVYQPLQDELFRRGWIKGTASASRDRLGRKRYAFIDHTISYLVVCRGVPLRIGNDPALLAAKGRTPEQLYRNDAAVDAELSLVALGDYEITGLLRNPLFESRIESPGAGVVKVSRLDGPTDASARQLVTSAKQAEEQGVIGRYYVDRGGPHASADGWLAEVQRQLAAQAFDGDVEDTAERFSSASRFDAPAFYFGWYTSDLDGPMAQPGFRFRPGAIAMHIHSYSAPTLRSATRAWCGPLVAHGAAATVGNVEEPYLEFTHRPDLLVRALIQGKTWGDAVYYALPVLSWQAVAIGDPLYRPFKVPLAEQLRSESELEPEQAAYVLGRATNRLKAEGRAREAIDLLSAARRELRTAAWRVALVDQLIDARELERAAAVADDFEELDGPAWPLVRGVAGRLAQGGAVVAALKLYAEVARADAPSREARNALLREAAAVAEKSGDTPLAAEFRRQEEGGR